MIFDDGNFLFLERRIKIIIRIVIIIIIYLRVRILRYNIFIRGNLINYLFKIVFLENLSR